MALLDACAVDDPLVIRLNHFLKIGVCQYSGRSVTAEGGNLRSKEAQFP
jgi:hypothetical protein